MTTNSGKCVAYGYQWDGVWENGTKWAVKCGDVAIKEYSTYNPFGKYLAKFYAWRHNL